jgi:lipopolysaccharide transport system ATP-binding protein
MADLAIRSLGLSKRYRIGERQPYRSFRETFMRTLASPFRRTRERGRETIWALRDVSFQVDQGEVVGIIGRNGAGKSTLLKILSRITDPTEGRAEIRGRVASLLEVGTGFHHELTGRENIFLSGAILGMKRAEILTHFDQIVSFAEVEKFVDTPVKWYSSGMYLRLAFAVAAHLQPEVLLVDEVLAVGDAAFQKKCLGRMGEVARGGRTVLFVSHNLTAVKKLCQKGVVLEAGRVVRAGGISECVNHYVASLESTVATDRDVADLPRPYAGYGTSLRFTGVRLIPDETGSLRTNNPLALEIEFDCAESLEEVILGFSVFSAEGPRLMMCLNVHDGPPIGRLEPGKYRVKATIEFNPLLPGRYILDLGARSSTKGLDWVPELLYFEVVEAPSTILDFHLPEHGHFYIGSTWEGPHSREPGA